MAAVDGGGGLSKFTTMAIMTTTCNRPDGTAGSARARVEPDQAGRLDPAGWLDAGRPQHSLGQLSLAGPG